MELHLDFNTKWTFSLSSMTCDNTPVFRWGTSAEEGLRSFNNSASLQSTQIVTNTYLSCCRRKHGKIHHV